MVKQLLQMIIVHIQSDDVMIPGQQTRSQVFTDKTVGASNQYFHRDILLIKPGF